MSPADARGRPKAGGDPAALAALRTARRLGPSRTPVTHAYAAADAALAPIRRLHVSITNDSGRVCVNCRRAWPCGTARLIYTPAELDRSRHGAH